MRHAKLIALPLFYLVVGFGVGILFSGASIFLPDVSASKQVRLGEGRLINPLLECEIAEGTIDAEKINFKGDLTDFVERVRRDLKIQDIAIYFRDLNNGPTFGIHQNDSFVPASLLKVPVMMAYYRKADNDPSVLEKKLLFVGSELPDGQQTILPAKRLTAGTEYTIEKLIEQMIVYSDNDALLLLFKALPLADHTHLYNLLGVDSAVITNPTASLTAKQYAAFFRILYNASFLSQERSEKALSLLSQTDFDQGLRAGVPSEVIVAHKFGERQINTGERHLHDCGIVYYPKHPYILCIMTRGAETPTLARAVASISEFVYKQIDEQYR